MLLTESSKGYSTILSSQQLLQGDGIHDETSEFCVFRCHTSFAIMELLGEKQGMEYKDGE